MSDGNGINGTTIDAPTHLHTDKSRLMRAVEYIHADAINQLRRIANELRSHGQDEDAQAYDADANDLERKRLPCHLRKLKARIVSVFPSAPPIAEPDTRPVLALRDVPSGTATPVPANDSEVRGKPVYRCRDCFAPKGLPNDHCYICNGQPISHAADTSADGKNVADTTRSSRAESDRPEVTLPARLGALAAWDEHMAEAEAQHAAEDIVSAAFWVHVHRDWHGPLNEQIVEHAWRNLPIAAVHEQAAEVSLTILARCRQRLRSGGDATQLFRAAVTAATGGK